MKKNMSKSSRKSMKKKIVLLLSLVTMACMLFTGCGSTKIVETSEKEVQVDDTQVTGTEVADTEEGSLSDQELADHVAELIDAIYVQVRTEETDSQCAEAKAAWDALTDTQKQLVSGENADPDYFGRDTGDASKDDSLNADDIGENEILVVSFGTSFNDSRVADIGGIEKAIQDANPDWSVRRAFTAQIIINHVQARDNEKIDNMDQALERAVKNGVKNLIIQPTHLMHGAEYDEMMELYASLVNIEDLLHKPVRQMSLGQRTLSDILAAFLHNPKIVFLDEPTIGLDVAMKSKIRELIKELNKQRNTTVILTTHDMGDVDALCERIIIIDKGKMLYDNDIKHLRTFFGAYRTLKIRPAEKMSEVVVHLMDELNDLDVQISHDDEWISIVVNEEKIKTLKVLDRIQQTHRIKDMQLEEISTEDVIKKIYKEGVE